MTVQELQEKLIDAVAANRISDEVLPPSSSFSPSPSSALSAEADVSAVSSSLVVRSIHELTDSINHVNLPCDFAAQFSYDGGMELSIYGSWACLPSGNFLLDVLKPLKQKAVDTNSAVSVVVGDCAFWLLPHGAKSGYGNYSYKLIFEEEGRTKYVFLLHTSPCPSIAGVRVKCEYQAFRRCRRLADLRDELQHIIDLLGFRVDRYCLSRIDFNLTTNHDLGFLCKSYFDGRITNRCRGYELCGAKDGTFKYFRAGDLSMVQFAAYDKTQELIKKYDFDKVTDLSAALGSPVGQSWTRYEFRLGRKFLHSIGIDTFDDYIQSEVAIVNFLTLYWFNVRLRKSKWGKTSNYKLDYFWRLVRYSLLLAVSSGRFVILQSDLKSLKNNDLNKHYRTLLRDGDIPTIKRTYGRKFRYGAKRLFKLSLGCIVSALAMSSPSGVMLDKVDFNKTVTRSVSFFIDEAFESYQSRFKTIQGDIQRNYNEAYVDKPSTLLGFGGSYNA